MSCSATRFVVPRSSTAQCLLRRRTFPSRRRPRRPSPPPRGGGSSCVRLLSASSDSFSFPPPPPPPPPLPLPLPLTSFPFGVNDHSVLSPFSLSLIRSRRTSLYPSAPCGRRRTFVVGASCGKCTGGNSSGSGKKKESEFRIWEVPAARGGGGEEEGTDGGTTGEGDNRGRRKCFGGRQAEGGGFDGSGWVELRPFPRGDEASDELGGEGKARRDSPPPPPGIRHRAAEYLQFHVLRHFLPEGYPASVSPSYLSYATNCFAASACGSAAFVLSTQALLLAVGVGSADAAPYAAALNWVLKDGLGQLGGVIFASKLGSGAMGRSGGSTIDSDPKRWRMVAALALDSATFLEILSPLFPGYFLPIASVANVGKNVGFLAAGASRAALHQSLAKADNLGDVTAKAGSQSIAASLVGTGMGLVLSPWAGGDVTRVAAGFAALSACHQFCNYKALRAVPLETLNRHRLNLVLERFVRDAILSKGTATDYDSDAKGTQSSAADDTDDGVAHFVLSPTEVAERENFLPLLRPDDSDEWLTVGCGVRELCPDGPEQLLRLARICGRRGSGGDSGRDGNDAGSDGFSGGKGCRYILNCDVDGSEEATMAEAATATGKARDVRLVFLEDADGRDVVSGMLHAHVLRSCGTAPELEALVLAEGNNGDGNDAAADEEWATSSERIIAAAGSLSSRYVGGLLAGLDRGGWRVGDGSVCVEGGSAGSRLAIENASLRAGEEK